MLLADQINLDSDMNDPNSSPPIDSGQNKQEGAPLSAGRRRFAKGVAPVVLGTLVSKPVLGAEYICTVSGTASGNASAHRTDDAGCNVGRNVDHWLANDWPAAYTKGGLPVANTTTTTCDFEVAQGTLFKEVTIGGVTLASVFFYSAANNENPCRAVFNAAASGRVLSRPASLYQVLARTGGGEAIRLGRATVASLLNAADPNIAYPISAQRIIQMFNAVNNDGTYHVDGANLKMTRLGVIEYFEKLYS